MKNTLILATMFAFSTFVSAEDAVNEKEASAQEAAPMANEFTALDTNLDGFVSLDEAGSNESLMKQFAKLDADKSGDLTSDEFSKYTAATK